MLACSLHRHFCPRLFDIITPDVFQLVTSSPSILDRLHPLTTLTPFSFRTSSTTRPIPLPTSFHSPLLRSNWKLIPVPRSHELAECCPWTPSTVIAIEYLYLYIFILYLLVLFASESKIHRGNRTIQFGDVLIVLTCLDTAKYH